MAGWCLIEHILSKPLLTLSIAGVSLEHGCSKSKFIIHSFSFYNAVLWYSHNNGAEFSLCNTINLLQNKSKRNPMIGKVYGFFCDFKVRVLYYFYNFPYIQYDIIVDNGLM